MKLYLISQEQNNDYDTYDSAVVAAPDEESARNILPGGGTWEKAKWRGDWCKGPEHVKVQYLGRADKTIDAGVICASFNAG